MNENLDESYNFRNYMEEYSFQNSNNNTDNDNNKSEEQKNVNISISNNNNNHLNIFYEKSSLEKTSMNENLYYNSMSFLFNNDKQNMIDNASINESNNNNKLLNGFIGDIYLNNYQVIEQNDNKKTAITNNNMTMTLNGKQINTNNEQISVALNKLYNTSQLNLETKNDMQFFKSKKRRRTNKEIEEDKRKNNIEVDKINKKKGRKKKDDNNNVKSEHSKKSDDNIMKKINSHFLESVRNWLNNSFLDDEGNFESLKARKKKKKKIFLKINPKLIATNLKKSSAISVMDDIFKNIFAKDISIKYATMQKSENIDLINKIYEEKNQPFVIFILESKFIDILNFFGGQKDEKYIIKNFENSYNQKMIEKFLNNFSRIKNFLSKIYNKENKGNEENKKEIIDLKESKDYLERISLLVINYKEWFDKKYHRENKKK